MKRQQQDSPARDRSSSAFEEVFRRFCSYLEGDETARRVRTEFLTKCDAREVFVAAARFNRNSPVLAESRKTRGISRTAPLRRRASQLRSEIRKGGRDPFKMGELYLIEDGLKKAKDAFATKRLGVAGTHYDLFFLHEYLTLTSGDRPNAIDLTAILQAALLAMGSKTELNVDAVRMNLRNFIENNPVFCAQLTTNLSQTLFPSSAPQRY